MLTGEPIYRPIGTTPAAKPCTGCGGKEEMPILPERVIKLNMPDDPRRKDGHGWHFNPGLIEFDGKLLLSSRLGWVGSKIYLSELGSDLQSVRTWQVDSTHPMALHGSEDARLFMCRGKLHVAYTGYHKPPYKGFCQLYGELSEGMTRIEPIHMPDYAAAKATEKNWNFYDHDGELYSVYSNSPHTILKHDGATVQPIAATRSPIAWKGTEIRGGAPPVRVGDEYWHFFHTFATKGGKKVYTMGAYAFAARPPFEITRHLPYPLLKADWPAASGHSIVFPCGAVLRGGKWLISFGVNDCESRIAIFDQAEISEAMQ